MTKKKSDSYNFVTMPDLKCSYFLVENKQKGNDVIALLLRLEEGRHKGIIVEISKFELAENSNNLTFNYDVVYNPYEKIPNVKTIETFIRKTVGRIITNALSCVLLNEGFPDENRISDSEVVTS